VKENFVRIRIDDIPHEGRKVSFDLDLERINARVDLSRESQGSPTDLAPKLGFISSPLVEMSLTLEGSTVIVQGSVKARYRSLCARCAEDTEQSLETNIDLVLKPHSERSVLGEEEEDLNFGVYDGETVDCSSIAEEFLVLALPFTTLCSKDCKGLCPHCGTNLNLGSCECRKEAAGDPRLQVLRDLKLVQ